MTAHRYLESSVVEEKRPSSGIVDGGDRGIK